MSKAFSFVFLSFSHNLFSSSFSVYHQLPGLFRIGFSKHPFNFILLISLLRLKYFISQQVNSVIFWYNNPIFFLPLLSLYISSNRHFYQDLFAADSFKDMPNLQAAGLIRFFSAVFVIAPSGCWIPFPWAVSSHEREIFFGKLE